MKSIPALLAIFSVNLSALNLKAASMFLAPESEKLKKVANIATAIADVLFIVDVTLTIVNAVKKHKKPAEE